MPELSVLQVDVTLRHISQPTVPGYQRHLKEKTVDKFEQEKKQRDWIRSESDVNLFKETQESRQY